MLQKISIRMQDEGIATQILDTNAAGNYDYLPAKIEAEQITDVVVCGGDGTVRQIAAVLQHSKVNVGIIPMGSGNGLAFAAGIPKKVEKALSIILANKPVEVDGFLINGEFSCMLCGLGLDAQVAHDFDADPNRGLKTYIKQVYLNLVRTGTYPFTLCLPQGKIDTKAFFISIANSNQFGNNVTIAPKASISDGLLDIVIVPKMHKARLLYSLFKQTLWGSIETTATLHTGRQDIQYFQAKELTLFNPKLAPLHIDGDPAKTSAEFHIKIVPGAFRLLM